MDGLYSLCTPNSKRKFRARDLRKPIISTQ